MEKITGKTTSGFEFEYDKRILTDWDYISLLRVMLSDNSKNSEKLDATHRVFLMLLGEEQTKKLVAHIRNYNDGFAPIEAVVKEFKEIVEPKN